MWIRLAVVLALPLVLAGCGDGGDDDPGTTGRIPRLDGTAWIATTITEGDAEHPLVAGSTLRVDFSDGNIAISAGCNHIGGSYTLSDDGVLGFGALMSTEMGCDPPLMDQDNWLAGTVFGSPLTAVVDGDTLTLSRSGLVVVLSDREVASPDAPLQGTGWQLDGIQDGDAVSSVPTGTRVPTLEIAEDGTVTVDTGCNRGRSTATVDGSTITFGPVLTTKMACAEESGRRTEAAVLAVLDGAVAWSVTEQSLTLTRGDRGLTYRVQS
jgi:heat shock protein HslJ